MFDANAFFAIALLAIAGAYSLWQGWLRINKPSSELALMASPEMLTVMLVSVFQGEQKAAQKKAEMTAPERMRRSGQYYLAGGGLFLTGAILQIVLVIVSRVK